jgi:hypothetical protein
LKKNILKGLDKMFVTFDSESGKILSCSVNESPNSLPIDNQLGEKFIMGIESMFNYKIQYMQGIYKLSKRDVVQKENLIVQNKTNTIINQGVYKIPNKTNNHKGILIKILEKQKKIEFVIDENFKNTLKITVTDTNQRIHNFYSCKKNDATQLDRIFEINLYELATKKMLSFDYTPNDEVDIYCKKVFDYSLERIYE